MKKDPQVFIKHITESIEIIYSHMGPVNKTHFLEDKKLQDAVIRRLEIIGEAVKNLPNEFTKKYSDIPWAKMARMRDKLIHAYFGVDLELAFDVIRKDLPDLQKQLNKINGKQ